MKIIFGKTSQKVIECLIIFLVVIINLTLINSKVDDLTIFERGFSSIVLYPGEFVTSLFFIVEVIVAIVSTLISLISNKRAYLIGLGYTLINTIAFIIVKNIYGVFNDLSTVIFIIELLLILLGVFYYIACLILNPSSFSKNDEDYSLELKQVKVQKTSKVFILFLSIVCLISTLICLFIPLYSYQYTTTDLTEISFNVIPFSVITDSKNATIATFLSFIVLFGVNLANIGFLLSSLVYFKNDDGIYVKKTKDLINLNFAISIIYFIAGITVSFFVNKDTIYNVTTTSYVPFIIMSIVMVLFAIASVELPLVNKKNTEKKFPKFEMLIYTILFTALPILSYFVTLVEIKVDDTTKLSLKAFEIVRDHEALSESYQLASFFLIILSILAICMFVISLTSYFRNKSLFYKFSMVTILVDMLVIFATGTFGVYYKIVQKMNEESLAEIALAYGFTYTANYEINSQTIYVFIAAVIILIFVIIRNPLKDMPADEFKINAINDGAIIDDQSGITEQNDNKRAKEEVQKESPKEEVQEEPQIKKLEDFDSCPAFSELDSKKKEFDLALKKRNANLFTNPSLINLTNFIVEYAKESRLHLSYSLEDIATFISGLGATRLSILQGMSGTGKTSLPKIFIEAIMGNCEIIEVESSWRDKNELLGYYNEFSKTYTPKKFTQALYKAKLNSTVPTFIVLDEMNLSRIEYYFSDFLSLMENEEDKREIKLLNVKLYNIYENKKHSYMSLSDDHTIKIPTNVWFIGTANRDESTFEISDKVYDRANTMNFNKRAPKAIYTGLPLDNRFVPYEMLSKLLNDAKESYQFNIDENVIVKEVEKILSPYNISFGNRISNQIENFVKIYCSCFENSKEREKEAVEKILLSKVVAKLENKNIENKELLISEFERLKLKACADFVAKLNED